TTAFMPAASAAFVNPSPIVVVSWLLTVLINHRVLPASGCTSIAEGGPTSGTFARAVSTTALALAAQSPPLLAPAAVVPPDEAPPAAAVGADDDELELSLPQAAAATARVRTSATGERWRGRARTGASFRVGDGGVRRPPRRRLGAGVDQQVPEGV